MKWADGEIEGVTIRTPVKHADSRGWLAEVFRSDEMHADVMPQMCYLSVTRPGVARGPHEHKEQADVFGFLGPGTFKVMLWDNRRGSATFGHKLTAVVGEQNPAVITVPPGVVHGYRNISQADAFVLNLPNRLYAGKGKKLPVDEIRYEDGSNPEFALD